MEECEEFLDAKLLLVLRVLMVFETGLTCVLLDDVRDGEDLLKIEGDRGGGDCFDEAAEGLAAEADGVEDLAVEADGVEGLAAEAEGVEGLAAETDGVEGR